MSVALTCSCKPSAEITFSKVASSGLIASLTCNLAHSFSPGNISWCSCNKLRITILKSSFKISRNILDGAEV